MGKYTAQDRRDLATKGHALPDGSFPIHDVEDLHSAIRNIGRGNHPDIAKQHIIKRAKALNAYDELPEKWRENIEHTDQAVEEFLQHFGIKGMRWGKHKEEYTNEKADRKAAQIKRGEDTLYRTNAFGSPNVAVGMKATQLIMSGVGAGLAIRGLRDPKLGKFKVVKQGLAIGGLVLTGIGAASTIRDIRDVNAYKKSQEQSS